MKERPIILNSEMVLALLAGQPCDLSRYEFDKSVPYRFWVREDWRTTADQDHLKPRDCCIASTIQYMADMEFQYAGEKPQPMGKWRRSIYMPKLFSRLTLTVKKVGEGEYRILGEVRG